MKGFSLILLLSVFCHFHSIGQNSGEGYSISISVDDWKDPVAYLGYYINKSTYLQDTADVVNGKVVFEGEKDLIPGLYFLYTPNNLFFEFLVNESTFELSTNIADISGRMKIKGSVENEHFFAYQNKMLAFQKMANTIKEEEIDSIERISKLKSINQQVKDFQFEERDLHKGTYFSQFISLMIRPQVSVPDHLSKEEKTKYRISEYKKHFWDGANFRNPGLIRNPVFDPKLNEYFDRLVYNEADSINQSIDQFLSLEMDTTVYRYMIVSLTNKYASSKTMGHDAVYVHMVDEYYASGKAYWIDDVTLTRMKQNTDRLKPILIGEPAPSFISEDIAGKTINNPFTTTDKAYKIMFFYDSGCGHCKKATPKLMKAFHSLQESKISVDVISMNLSEDRDEWKTFVDTYGLEGQVLGDTKTISNAGYYYFIDTTPQIYVLDESNKIIGKKIAADKVDDFLKEYIKFQGN